LCVCGWLLSCQALPPPFLLKKVFTIVSAVEGKDEKEWITPPSLPPSLPSQDGWERRIWAFF
jgi:hypothetical protein